MKQIKIGSDTAGAIGLGCMGMSHAYGASDDKQSIKVLERALELGCNFWDTSDFYGFGKNEKLLGLLLKNHKNKIFICTKTGLGLATSVEQAIKDAMENKPAQISVCARPDYIKKAVDLSLQRLNVDTIDLYYLHRLDKDVPVEDSVGAMADLVSAGKIKYIGLSEVSSETIRRASKVHEITALQSEYSIWTRDIESSVLPTCRELKIIEVAYSPLGWGFLTGKLPAATGMEFNDARKVFPRIQGEFAEKNAQIVKNISTVALKHNASNAQIALSWLLSRGEQILPIPGTRNIKYLEENIRSLDIDLDDEDMKLLDNIEVYGSRFAGGMERLADI